MYFGFGVFVYLFPESIVDRVIMSLKLSCDLVIIVNNIKGRGEFLFLPIV